MPKPMVTEICLQQLQQQGLTLGARPADSHKGDYGHVLVMGGNIGFGGALLLTAEAALRCGAGLVSGVTRAQHLSALLARCPSVMALGVESGLEVQPLLNKATVLAVGPGLGQDGWAELLLQQALYSDLPMVLDADGLNLLAQQQPAHNFSARQVVLTPHAMEAARLLQVPLNEIQGDRSASALALAKRYQALVVLKGQRTVIAASDGRIVLCTDGNPGMSSAGMGDVLTGVLAALIAQHADVWQAVCLGVCLHSAAADQCGAEHGQRGMLASDLFAYLHRLNN